MSNREEVFNDHQKIGFQKFATNILKKDYPFISKLNFRVFPVVDSLDFTYNLDVFLDYKYLVNSERVLRHISLEELKMRVKREEIVSAWETRLFFHPFSSSDLANKVQELVSVMTGNEKINKLYNVWDVRYLIDPTTYVS